MELEKNTIFLPEGYKFEPTELRNDPNYVLFYINLTKNSLTGLLPLALLATMNFLVYRKLVKRRKEMERKIHP